MAATTLPHISLEANQSGNDLDLALKMYSGEVFATFDEKNKFLEKIMSKNVGAGSSHQFIFTSDAEAVYHAAGKNILDPSNNLLNEFEQGEQVISIDRPLMSNFVTEDWDRKIAHYDTRAEYARKTGHALAVKLDRDIAQVLALAAAATSPLSATKSPEKDGYEYSAASVGTSASAMIDAMIACATNFVEKDVPTDDLCFVVRPSMFFALQKDGQLLDQDFGNAGNGSQAYGKILKGYGFNIMWSNHIPDGIVTANTGENNTYTGDFSDLEALAFHREAAGVVYREGIVTESQRKLEYQGDLVTARMMVGVGILRTECAASISNTP